jgi:recombination protein RecR
MFRELSTLTQLLSQLQQVPYLASKNVYRVAEHFLTMKPEQVEQFCAMLLRAKQNIVACGDCFAWKERAESCLFCASDKRDQQLVCVVETWQELMSIEKTRGYTGVYHVLGGVICPLDGVGPEDLSIDVLFQRIEKKGIREIILATNQTPEGEATAAFIASQLSGKSVLISCLARGLPVGSSLDCMDRVTVYKALSERRPF